MNQISVPGCIRVIGLAFQTVHDIIYSGQATDCLPLIQLKVILDHEIQLLNIGVLPLSPDV